jgi:hypothetical protein
MESRLQRTVIAGFPDVQAALNENIVAIESKKQATLTSTSDVAQRDVWHHSRTGAITTSGVLNIAGHSQRGDCIGRKAGLSPAPANITTGTRLPKRQHQILDIAGYTNVRTAIDGKRCSDEYNGRGAYAKCHGGRRVVIADTRTSRLLSTRCRTPPLDPNSDIAQRDASSGTLNGEWWYIIVG